MRSAANARFPEVPTINQRTTGESPKGEFVLVLAGAPETIEETATPTDAAARVQALMDDGRSRKDAIKQTAKELNLPKNVVYDAALNMDE